MCKLLSRIFEGLAMVELWFAVKLVGDTYDTAEALLPNPEATGRRNSWHGDWNV